MEPQGNSPGARDGMTLGRWLDGELSAGEAEALERRMAMEAGLRREAETLGGIDGLLERWPTRGEAPDVRGAVLARIERSRQAEGGWKWPARRWGAPAWAASWAACGILLGLLVLGAVEIQPAGESGTVVASAEEDLTLSSFLDDALGGADSTVDSIAEWIEEPETEAAP